MRLQRGVEVAAPAAHRRPAARAWLLALVLAVSPAAAAQPGAGDADAPAVASLDVLTRARTLRGLRLSVVGQLLRGAPGGEIALAALAVPETGGDEPALRLAVEIDGASFLGANTAAAAPVELYAYLLRADGSVAAYLAEGFFVDVAGVGQAIWNSGLLFLGRLAAAPEVYRLKVMVRNPASGARGIAEVTAPLPEPAGDVLPPPRFPQPADRDGWQVVLGATATGRDGWTPPAALPVLLAGRRARGLLATPLPTGAGASIELVPAGESEAEALGRVPIEPLAGTGDDTGVVAFSLTVPELPSGPYGARLVVGDGGGRRTSEVVPVLVSAASAQERSLLWSDVRWLSRGGRPGEATAAAAPDAAGASERAARRRRSRRLERRYAEILRLLAAGRDGEALSALLELEGGVLARPGRQRLDALRAAQVAVARRLAAREAALVLPLLVLHERSHQLYLGRRLFSLVAHGRLLLEELAEVHAEAGGPAALTAAELASLGGHLQHAHLPAGSRRLFQRALAHEPDNAAALLGLALSFEKYAEHAEAVSHLERLVEADPELREARLRLAINLQRIGERRRFRALLEALVAGTSTDWVSALACQELARLHLRLGATAEAEALLGRAVRQMPASQALRLQLAHVLDRSRRPAAALELIEVLGGTAAAAAAERALYDRWESSPLRAARRTVREAAAAAAPRLAATLDENGEER